MPTLGGLTEVLQKFPNSPTAYLNTIAVFVEIEQITWTVQIIESLRLEKTTKII